MLSRYLLVSLHSVDRVGHGLNRITGFTHFCIDGISNADIFMRWIALNKKMALIAGQAPSDIAAPMIINLYSFVGMRILILR